MRISLGRGGGHTPPLLTPDICLRYRRLKIKKMVDQTTRVTLKYSDKPPHFEVFGLLYLTKRDRPYMSCLFPTLFISSRLKLFFRVDVLFIYLRTHTDRQAGKVSDHTPTEKYQFNLPICTFFNSPQTTANSGLYLTHRITYHATLFPRLRRYIRHSPAAIR